MNSRLMLVSRFVSIGISLLIVPVIIRAVGLKGFGAWESILALTTTIALFQNILKSALVWSISNAYGGSRTDDLASQVRFGFTCTLTCFLVGIPLITALRYPILRLLSIDNELIPILAWVLPMAAAVAFLNGITDTLSAILIGHQRSGFSTLICSVGLIVQSCVAFALLWCGFGIQSLLIGFASNVAVSLLMHYVTVKRMCGGMPFGKTLPGKEQILGLVRYARSLSIGTICTLLRSQTDRVALAAFGSSELVGNYGVALRLAAVINEVTNLFYTPSIAAAGALNSGGGRTDVDRLYLSLNRMVLVVVGATGAMAIAAGADVMRLWSRVDLPDAYFMLILLLSGSVTAAILTGAGTAIGKGIGKPELESKYLVLTAVCNILLLPLTIHWLGPIGSIAASSLAWVIGSIYFVALAYGQMGLPLAGVKQSFLAVAFFFAAGWTGKLGGFNVMAGSGSGPLIFRAATAGIIAASAFYALAMVFKLSAWPRIKVS